MEKQMILLIKPNLKLLKKIFQFLHQNQITVKITSNIPKYNKNKIKKQKFQLSL